MNNYRAPDLKFLTKGEVVPKTRDATLNDIGGNERSQLSGICLVCLGCGILKSNNAHWNPPCLDKKDSYAPTRAKKAYLAGDAETLLTTMCEYFVKE